MISLDKKNKKNNSYFDAGKDIQTINQVFGIKENKITTDQKSNNTHKHQRHVTGVVQRWFTLLA